MDGALSWSRKVEGDQGHAALEVVANLDLEAERDRNQGQDPNLLDDPDHLQQEGLVRDLGRSSVGEQDPGLESVVRDLWRGKMEHQTKDQLLAVEVELQKEADQDLDPKTGRKEMGISRTWMQTKNNKDGTFAYQNSCIEMQDHYHTKTCLSFSN